MSPYQRSASTHSRRVERHLAAVVDELAALGERDVLERLGGEAVAGLGGQRDPGHAVAVELLGGRASRRRATSAPRARPCRTGPCGRSAAGPSRRSGRRSPRRRGSRGRAPSWRTCRGRACRRPPARPRRRRSPPAAYCWDWSSGVASTTSGRSPARRGVGHQRRELVLGHRDQLGLDAGLLRELVEDRLRRLHAVGLELVVPDGQRLAAGAAAAATAAVVVAVAAAARGHGGEDGAHRSALHVACSPLSSCAVGAVVGERHLDRLVGVVRRASRTRRRPARTGSGGRAARRRARRPTPAGRPPCASRAGGPTPGRRGAARPRRPCSRPCRAGCGATPRRAAARARRPGRSRR